MASPRTIALRAWDTQAARWLEGRAVATRRPKALGKRQKRKLGLLGLPDSVPLPNGTHTTKADRDEFYKIMRWK